MSKDELVLDVVGLLTRAETARAGQRMLAESWVRDHAGALRRLCPHCASTAHGQPRVPGQHISLAYAPGLVVVALANAPVGVDVEVDGAAPEGFADRLAWTRVEAMLKATGQGLQRDPTTVLESEAWTDRLPLPASYVGSVAVVGQREPRVTWRTESPEASSHGARG